MDSVQFMIHTNETESLERLDDLIRTGPTGTNVGDLQIILTL